MDHDQSAQILSSLFDKQTNLLQEQLHQAESKLEGLKYLQRQRNSIDNFSTEVQEEVLSSMNMTKKLHYLRLKMLGW